MRALARTGTGIIAATAPTTTAAESTRLQASHGSSIPIYEPTTVKVTSRDSDWRDGRSVTVIPRRYSPFLKRRQQNPLAGQYRAARRGVEMRAHHGRREPLRRACASRSAHPRAPADGSPSRRSSRPGRHPAKQMVIHLDVEILVRRHGRVIDQKHDNQLAIPPERRSRGAGGSRSGRSTYGRSSTLVAGDGRPPASMRSASMTVLVASSPVQKSGTVSGCFSTAALETPIRAPADPPARSRKRHIHVVVARRHREAARDPERLTRRAPSVDRKDDVERIRTDGGAPLGGRASRRAARTYISALGGGQRRPIEGEREGHERARSAP